MSVQLNTMCIDYEPGKPIEMMLLRNSGMGCPESPARQKRFPATGSHKGGVRISRTTVFR
jgi:hypothetical protein